MGKFTDIPKLAQKIVDEFSSKQNLRILGEDAKKLIQKRTRLGGGVERSLGPRVKLKKLSDPYKRQRKRSRLDSTTTPAKSNLTRTGGMLRDIGVKVGFRKAIIRFITPFAKLKARWVQDAGRKFFFISKPEFKQLQNKLTLKIQKLVSKLNK